MTTGAAAFRVRDQSHGNLHAKRRPGPHRGQEGRLCMEPCPVRWPGPSTLIHDEARAVLGLRRGHRARRGVWAWRTGVRRV